MKNLTKIPSYKLLTFFEINKKTQTKQNKKEKVNRRSEPVCVKKSKKEDGVSLRIHTHTTKQKKKHENKQTSVMHSIETKK